MNRRQIIPLLGLPLLLAGCGEDSQTWRQKLRVVVATPAGAVAGEAVAEGFIIEVKGMAALGRGEGVSGRITQGEATVVDLGDGRYLFALLGPNDASWYLPFHTFLNGFPSPKWETYVKAAHEFALVKGPQAVPPLKYPLLVTFGDINNPKTVKQVDPANLAASFGPGYALKSITLEITDEPVTEGEVEKVLGWINMPREKFLALGGGKNPMKIAEGELTRSLGRGSFIQGASK
jgi:hypothetical protein